MWDRPLRSADRKGLADTAPDEAQPLLGIRVADEGVEAALIADAPDVFLLTTTLRRLPRRAGPAGGCELGAVQALALLIEAGDWFQLGPVRPAQMHPRVDITSGGNRRTCRAHDRRRSRRSTGDGCGRR